VNGALRTEEALIFNWAQHRPRKRSIATFLAISLLAHAFCFYAFQIVYPPSVALLPPAARVHLISPATENGRAVLRWIEAEDPALTVTTVRPPDSKTYALPRVEHVPSYAGWVPALKEIPAIAPDLDIPSAAPPGPVVIPRTFVPPPYRLQKSAVTVSEELQEFGELGAPRASFSTSLLDAPNNVRFRIGVNRFGQIRYCLPLGTSGDAALDEQARAFIVQSRFARQPGEKDEDVWG